MVTPDATGSATLPQWQDTTRRAIACAAEGHLAAARQLHAQALGIARALLAGGQAAARPDDCLAALVVAHHNLADVLAALGAQALAVDELCAAHDTLRTLVRDAAADPALRQAAWRHHRETHAALLLYLRAHGPDDAIARCLAADADPAETAH
ncbi:hypothetical protein [Xylophilus sp.]|uniref:hypothetical protein n=1 Tax=Xylophilus sp. TaxID=2653893 RepID=UPI0013B67653|nr:hypothetical protein [Xylophilus sp.]KAF1047185.1 MAG: hypothetical protein GAK38_02066 [Xylophilus sp.]